jgi:UDP-N-acetylmuramoyl-tripeptide--D-alanyl-D-alanine ligase
MDEAIVERIYGHFISSGGRVCTDTRKIEKSAVFFALKGENFNGNQFASKALEAGCSVVVIDEPQEVSEGKSILVPDVLKALQSLATYHRRQLKIPVLAITGSNAKTTHKELINAVLSKKFKTRSTLGNLNNHIGVPLTLLSLTREDEFAVVEMGANHQGEIADLCEIAEPDYGLITNIGMAHLEGFGGFEGVIKGKTEMYRFLKAKHNVVFVNGDDELLSRLAADNEKFTYGSKKLYDVIGRDCGNSETVRLKYTTRYGEKNWDLIPTINTQMTGRYNFINYLAAACIGVYFKVEDHLIREGLEQYRPEMNRSQLVHTTRNTLILDAYNANPDSMRAAIENFAKYSAPKKMLLLGDMFELGEFSNTEHNKIVQMLKALGFDNVILVGEAFYKTNDSGFLKFKTTAECRSNLAKQHPSDYTILVKGSRGMKMESLKEVL